MLPEEVNRLLDKWTIGHVLIIRKRFLESKPSKSNEIDYVGFRAMFCDLDQTLPLSAVSAAFKLLDSRKAGALTFRDICVGLATACLSSWDVRSKFLFGWFDSNGDGFISRAEMEAFLLCVTAAVHRAVESGDWSARFPFMSPSTREGFSLSYQARGLSPITAATPREDALERVQSAVTAVQSEVFSAIEGERRSVVNDHAVEFIPSESEAGWIQSELDSLLFSSDPNGVSWTAFQDWSTRNSHYLYKLLDLFEIVPSPDREKRACLAILRRSQLEPGTNWFVISYKWIQLWRSYVRWSDADNHGTVWNMTNMASPMASASMEVQHALSVVDMISCTSSVLQQRLSERPPAINNADIEGELKGALRANLVEHHDYVLVPEDMWKLLFDWYGGGPSFPRKVAFALPTRKLSSFRSVVAPSFASLELYPPLILVLMCSERGVPVRHLTKRFFVSRSDTCADLLDQLAKRLANRATQPGKSRLWHRRNGEDWELIQSDDPRRIDDFVDSVTTDAGAFMLECADARGQFPRDVLTNALHGEEELQVGDRVDATRPGPVARWKAATVVDVTDEKVKVHFDGEQYREDAWLGYNEIAPLGTQSAGFALKPKSSIISKLFGSKKIKKSVHAEKKIHQTTGLENIGNTCFMNATLQCLSYTPMLKSFFLSANLKGAGNLAGEFSSLLSDMWGSKKRTVAPKAFKKALDKFAPSFAGYEHQDAHELLALLLDGLHEDLNRPSSVPASGEDRAPGAEAWKKHRAENASIIADLFDGQQRVSTTCSACSHVSSVFEPFRYVMVPVPVTDDQRLVHVLLLPSLGGKIFQLSVVVPKASMFHAVLQALAASYKELSQELQIDWESGLVAAEVYMSRLHRFIDASSPISEFRSEDKIFLFQLAAVPSVVQRSRAVSDVTDTLLATSNKRSSSSADNLIVTGALGSAVRLGSPVRPRLGSAAEEEHTPECYAQIVQRREYVSRRQRRTVTRKELFGTPSVIAISASWTYGQLHAAVISHMSRFSANGSVSSFSVRITSPDGTTCAACGKLSCEGCVVAASSNKRVRVKGSWIYLAIDWISEESYSNLTVVRLEPPVFSAAPASRPRPYGAVTSLYDCMDAYTAREHLFGDNEWFCDKCKRKVEAERTTNWWLAPDVLVVLLKRFQYTSAGMEKIDVRIDFPVTDLVIKTGGNGNGTSKYDLYGIVNHTGSLSSGHYTAMCCIDDENHWCIFNDHRVIPVPTDEVSKCAAECARSCYVLFYKRKDTRTANLINYAPIDNV